jgi:hypothetical protein
MLGYVLRSYRVPTLLVDFDSPIKLAEQIIAVLMEFLQMLAIWGVLVDVVVAFGALVSVVVVCMIYEVFDTSLDHHD